MDLWEIFRGLEENLANHTNWMIIREFCINNINNMRDICHFKSLPASQLSQCRVPRPDAAAVFMSHKCRESRKQWIAYTDSMSRFLKPRYMISFFFRFCSRSGAEKQFTNKNQFCLQETVLLFLCTLGHEMGTIQYTFKSSSPVL